MEIKITTKNIYDYAAALTARIGKGADAYVGIAITKDNYPMLDVYLSSGIHLAETRIRKYLQTSSLFDLINEGDERAIMIKEDAGIAEEVKPMIISGMRLFLAYYIASLWLMTTAAKEFYEAYTTQANLHLDGVESALTERKHLKLDEADYELRVEDNVLMRPACNEPDNILTTCVEDGEPVVAINYKHDILKAQRHE